VPSTANQHNAIAAVELALAEAQRLAGRSLRELAPRDADGNARRILADGGIELGWPRRRSPREPDRR
jgi:hypothetical protein